VESKLGDRLQFAFRHFLLTEIRPHAYAATLQGCFCEKHEPLSNRQQALGDDDLRRYADQPRLEVAASTAPAAARAS
jgi:hypothetical protein